MQDKKRLIIAITGASGAIYGVRLLQLLTKFEAWETHLVVSPAGWVNLKHELNMTRQMLLQLADYSYDVNNIGATIASGAFKTEGMIVAPCSMKTLASIAHGFADNLISRSADVILKERRRLLIMPRETPLNLAHIRNMASLTEMGGIVFPPMPAYYLQSDSISEQVDQTVGRVLVMMGLDDVGLVQQWNGL